MKASITFVTGALLLICCAARLSQAQQTSEIPGAARSVQVVPAAETRQKWALLVGSNFYFDRQVGELSYCQDDVKAMKECLVKYAGVPESGCSFLGNF